MDETTPHVCNSSEPNQCTRLGHYPSMPIVTDPSSCDKCGGSLDRHSTVLMDKGVLYVCPSPSREKAEKAFKPWYAENCRQVDNYAQSWISFLGGWEAGNSNAADEIQKHAEYVRPTKPDLRFLLGLETAAMIVREGG